MRWKAPLAKGHTTCSMIGTLSPRHHLAYVELPIENNHSIILTCRLPFSDSSWVRRKSLPVLSALQVCLSSRISLSVGGRKRKSPNSIHVSLTQNFPFSMDGFEDYLTLRILYRLATIPMRSLLDTTFDFTTSPVLHISILGPFHQISLLPIPSCILRI